MKVMTPMIHKAKALLFSGLVLTATIVSPVQAEEIACTGKNLLSELKEKSPDLYATLENTAVSLPYGEGLLWKVEKKGVKPSYLFGTMHMADPRLIDLPAHVQKAFDESSTLALEITDILDPKALQQKAQGLMQYSLYLDGTTVEDRMTAEQVKVVGENFANRAPVPWLLAKRMRPWALIGALALPACENARKAAGKPFLDQLLAQKADAAGKELVSLETLESQMKVMASLPEEMMVDALVQTAKMGIRLDDVFETMISLYTQENTGLIWAMMKKLGPTGLEPAPQSVGYAEFQRELVDERNENMVSAALPLLDKGGAFIAIGALHLPGESGMLKILEQKGYRISAVR